MSRGPVGGLSSPHPLGERLPALYQEDSFTQRLLEALDEVLAPIFSTLDNLEAYLDPDLAPDDFLRWLGEWVGMALDDSWPLERRRAIVAGAAGLYRTRGTVAGLRQYVRLLTGGEVEILETGAAAYATAADAAPPGSPGFGLLVRVHPAPGLPPLDPDRLHALVAAAKPAHIAHRVEIE